ncbi:MAG: hypothetical protein HY904_05495 [Deltaproteobacteria bacterium]|nr:hypothetical protein [Deltaproteobacteria bacterium]
MAIRHTDVLVVGGELAGAVTAAVCARAGRRVVVLDDDECDDMVAAGVVVPPPDDFCPALESLSRAMAPLEALGQRQDLKRVLPVADGGFQVLHPAHRLDVFLDAERRLRDLRRECGEAAEAVQASLSNRDGSEDAVQALVDHHDAMAVDGFFATRRVRGAWRDGVRGEHVPTLALPPSQGWLADALHGGLAFLSASSQTPAVFQQRLLRALVAGVHVSPLGFRRTLRNQLLEAARQRGTDVIHDEHAAAFVVDGGRVSEVRLSGRNDALSARVVVDATLSRDVRDRISPEKYAARLDAVGGLARPARIRAGVSWVVRRAGLPPGLGARALLAAEDDQPGGGVALLGCLRAPLAADTRKPVPALAVVSASVICDPMQLQAAVERLVTRLERLLPFTRRHVVAELRTTEDTARLAPALYAGPDEPMALGGRGTDGGIKHFFRAGRDVAPALGVEGELWAGHAVAQRAEKFLSRRPLFGGTGGEAAQGLR